MNKKLLSIAVASALVAPSAFAATDTSGMRYTSASEGFYGSIRSRYVSGNAKNSGGDVQNASSRVGVQGTHDLGHGYEGFYQWELGVGIDDGSSVSTRLGNVGMRGDFGELILGSFWTFSYGATHGNTDQANTHSGYYTYTANRAARSVGAVQYTTPKFGEFQAAFRARFDNANTPSSRADLTIPVTTGSSGTNNATSDKNNLDLWNAAATYFVEGFTFGAEYNVIPEGLGQSRSVNSANNAITLGDYEDAQSWSVRGSYSQDNWAINTWYGSDNNSDAGFVRTSAPGSTFEAAALEDQTFLEVHGGIAVEKTNLYAIYGVTENANGNKGVDNQYTTVGVQYNLGARTRTWFEYVVQNYDGAFNGTGPDAADYVNIGLRFDF